MADKFFALLEEVLANGQGEKRQTRSILELLIYNEAATASLLNSLKYLGVIRDISSIRAERVKPWYELILDWELQHLHPSGGPWLVGRGGPDGGGRAVAATAPAGGCGITRRLSGTHTP